MGTKTKELLARRQRRVRGRIFKNRGSRPRLSIHRTNLHIYAQVIDDSNNVTLASASTLEKELRGKSGANLAAAQEVGRLIAERCKAAGIETVVFDRSGFLYHGRVKALADAAREGGLAF